MRNSGEKHLGKPQLKIKIETYQKGDKSKIRNGKIGMKFK